MVTDYTPLFLFLLVAILTAVGMLGASALLSPGRGRGTRTKFMPYESGMDPVGDARQRFDVRYYLVAIAFLLFDVELLLLYPWAVAQWSQGAPVATVAVAEGPIEAGARPALRELPPSRDAAELAARLEVGIPPAFRTMTFFGALVFLAILVAGFAYDWRKGVFEWR